MHTDDDLQALLDAADPATRRDFACAVAERLCERYEERFGAPVPERDVLAEAIKRARQSPDAGQDHPDLIAYAGRHPAPARDIASTLALALCPSAQAWEIAQLLPELCATRDDASDERRWMRERLHASLAAAQQTVLPPSPDVTRKMRPASPPDGVKR